MELWTYEHFISFVPAVIVMIIVTFILSKFLGDKPYHIRMIPFQILAAILFLSEVGKQALSFAQGYDLYHIPLHVCSLFIFLIPLMAFYNGKGKEVIRTFTCTVCMALSLFMAIYPNLIYAAGNITNFFNNYFDFHTVFFHNVVIFEFILIIGLKLHSTEGKSYVKPVLIGAICYSVVAAVMAQVLETNFSNFYSCNIGPLNDLINVIKDNIGYAAGQTIYVVVLTILHIGFFLGSYALYKCIEKLSKKVTLKLTKKAE